MLAPLITHQPQFAGYSMQLTVEGREEAHLFVPGLAEAEKTAKDAPWVS